jgi:hypothetical protein
VKLCPCGRQIASKGGQGTQIVFDKSPQRCGEILMADLPIQRLGAGKISSKCPPSRLGIMAFAARGATRMGLRATCGSTLLAVLRHANLTGMNLRMKESDWLSFLYLVHQDERSLFSWNSGRRERNSKKSQGPEIGGLVEARFALRQQKSVRLSVLQGTGNVTLDLATTKDPPPETVPITTGEIACEEWLGGLLTSYRRAV